MSLHPIASVRSLHSAPVDPRPGLRMRLHPASHWPEIASAWAELTEASPHRSFFLTQPWVESWLETFGLLSRTSILIFESASRVVGACLLVSTKERKVIFPIRRISVNTSGESLADTAYVEFNNLLCRSGWEREIVKTLSEYLLSQNWDEIALNGFCDGQPFQLFRDNLSNCTVDILTKPSFYVNLRSFRQTGLAYESSLGKTTRKHLRQQLRYYEKRGRLHVQAAQSSSDALSMLDFLAALHHRRWSSRGLPGAFASERFLHFHRSLIRRCFDQGFIQLLKVAAGEEAIGTLYNFVYQGKVYFYQSGFRYSDDKRLSPGTVTLFSAIQYCIDSGLDEFDFLAGDDFYKRSLSTDSRTLIWAVFRRPGLKSSIIDCLRRTKGRLHATAQRKNVLESDSKTVTRVASQHGRPCFPRDSD